MRAMRHVLVAELCALTLVCIFSCSRANKEEQTVGERTIVVETTEVIHRTTSFPIHTAGMVSLKETVKLSFKVGGIIDGIFADEGWSVRKGQVLARLDLSEIKAQVAKAQSAHEKAARDLERARNLFRDRVVTLEQLQDAETAFEIAQSDLEVVQFNLMHSTISAPSKGKILKRFSESGELVASGTPVFVFASTDKNWIIRFGVIDRDVVRLRLNDPAEVSFDVFPDRIFKARVSEIAETADPTTGTFEVELAIDDQASADLVAGFIAKVDAYPSKKERLSFIPIKALVEGNGKEGYVFVVDKTSSKAVKVPVKVSRIIDGQVAVGSGLEGVSEVIATGASYLVDGSKVQVKNTGLSLEE
jgi:multidrug efflux system membrane fusion protein